MIRPPNQDDLRVRQIVRLGEIIDDRVADLRFQRQVEKLHELGPRAYGELLAEIGEQRASGNPLPSKPGVIVINGDRS